MIDNGLIKYYRDKKYKNGILDLSQVFSDVGWKEMRRRDCQLCADGKTYYLKRSGKLDADAEVLLSQIYAKAGFDTAIYLPTYRFLPYDASLPTSVQAVISNDVKNGNDFAHIAIDKIALTNPMVKTPFSHEDRTVEEINFSQLMTQEAMEQYIKMHLYDYALYNYDRHGENFFLSVNDDNKIDGISLFDYGASYGVLISNLEMLHVFRNAMGGKFGQPGEGMMKVFKTNEFVQDHFTNSQMADIVGNIDVGGSVQDIKSEIGYSINCDYAKALEERVERVAEQFLEP